MLPELKNKNVCVVTDKHNKNVQHIHYPLSENDCVSIIIPSKDNPEILKVCFESIKNTRNTRNMKLLLLIMGVMKTTEMNIKS